MLHGGPIEDIRGRTKILTKVCSKESAPSPPPATGDLPQSTVRFVPSAGFRLTRCGSDVPLCAGRSLTCQHGLWQSRTFLAGYQPAHTPRRPQLPCSSPPRRLLLVPACTESVGGVCLRGPTGHHRRVRYEYRLLFSTPLAASKANTNPPLPAASTTGRPATVV